MHPFSITKRESVMTPKEFDLGARELGFIKVPGVRLPLYQRSAGPNSHYVARDASAKSGGYTLYLGYNLRPILDEAPPPGARDPIEAEAFFEYSDADSKGEALRQCFDFLRGPGQSFLDDPYALTPRQWRERHKLSVSEHTNVRVLVECDSSNFRTNDWIAFKAATALEEEYSHKLKKLFVAGVTHDVGVFPRGRATELKQAVEQLGGRVELRAV
jgi:hypothetical protein